MSDFFVLRLQFVHFSIVLSGKSDILDLQMQDPFTSVAKTDPSLAVVVFSFGCRASAALVDSLDRNFH